MPCFSFDSAIQEPFMQPHDFVSPFRRSSAHTMASFPQSQRHRHATLFRLCPARSITVNMPNLCPVRSITRSSTRHPHERVCPLRRQEPLVTISFPQSHRQRHAAQGPAFPARSRTTRRPNLLPTMSRAFPMQSTSLFHTSIVKNITNVKPKSIRDTLLMVRNFGRI